MRPAGVTRAGPHLWFWLVVAATLWAAVLRLPGLATLPPQAWHDEAWYNVTARDLLLSKTVQVFYPTDWGGMRPMLVVLAALVQAMGLHSLVASRVVTALAGVLAVPLTFVCCDELLRREHWAAPRRRLTAAVAAVVVSSLVFHLVASRMGQAPVLIPLFTLAAAWQMRRAERTRRLAGWALAGLTVGLAQYVNINGAFVLGTIGLLAVLDLVRARSPERLWLIGGMALMGVVAGLVALPLIMFFVREPQWLFRRVANVSPPQYSLSFFLDNARRIGLSFSIRGDFQSLQNVPNWPMLDWIQSAGFWAGLLWAGWRSRRSATAGDLLVWLGVACLPSLLSLAAPNFERMIGAAAPVAMLVAIGWSGIWQRVSAMLAAGRSPLSRLGARKAIQTTVAFGLGLASLGTTAYVYFGVYPRTPDLAEAVTATEASMARRMVELSHSQAVFVDRIPETDDVSGYRFLFPGSAVRRVDFRQCLPAVDGRATGTTYLIETGLDPLATAALQRLYPSARVTTVGSDVEELVGDFAVVELPAGARLALSHPAAAGFENGLQLLGYDWSGPTVAAGQDLDLTLYWRAGADLSSDYTAFVHIGRGEAGSALVAQHDGPPCGSQYPTSQWRSGDIVVDRLAIAIPAGTPAGTYPVLVGWYDSNTQQRLALVSAEEALPDNRASVGKLTVTGP